jgi:reversion-inducing-cysteine-rich protein with kazal motifs
MIDYHGPCRAVGLVDVESPCSTVKCPRDLPEDCLGFIPTGACCPVCGGGLKIIYSRKQIDRGIYALRNAHLETLTIKSILRSLQRLIKTSSCYLSGFLTFETDLMLIVYNIEKNPRAEQIEICRQEAVKISNLISTRSHHFTSNLGLSSFILANYVKPTISAATQLSSTLNFVSLMCFCIIFVSILSLKR